MAGCFCCLLSTGEPNIALLVLVVQFIKTIQYFSSPCLYCCNNISYTFFLFSITATRILFQSPGFLNLGSLSLLKPTLSSIIVTALGIYKFHYRLWDLILLRAKWKGVKLIVHVLGFGDKSLNPSNFSHKSFENAEILLFAWKKNIWYKPVQPSPTLTHFDGLYLCKYLSKKFYV